MILYMDSSSIVKLYVEEEHAKETRGLAQAADRLASTAIAFVEVKAAFARHHRERRIRARSQYQRINEDFDAQWQTFLVHPVTDAVIRHAGTLALAHPLSGYDAVHLASTFAVQTGTPEEVRLSTWDGQLARAARAEGLSLAHEVPK